ncbi:DNA binding protein [Vibrio phage D441]
MTNTTKAVKGFEWNKENTATAIEMYETLVANTSVENANSKESLGEIAKEIGAKSAASVRSKLSNEKVYCKAGAKRKVGGTGNVPKISYIRGLQQFAADNQVELNARKLESLESATVADIKDVITLVEAVTGQKVTIAGLETEEAPAPKAITAKA